MYAIPGLTGLIVAYALAFSTRIARELTEDEIEVPVPTTH